MRVLFLVEGNTDIRFVAGLAEVCSLTLVVPEAAYTQSGLKDRIAQFGAKLTIETLSGGRLLFPLRAFQYCYRHAKSFDVILAQEVTRGALAANLAGCFARTPVYNYMGISPLEYWSCRWERRQIPYWKHVLGYTVIKMLMTINGLLATGWLCMGTYLRDIGLQYCSNSDIGRYYGIDTDYFHPVTAAERAALRQAHQLPADAFLVFFASRMSHEKDPETLLQAAHLARSQGLNVAALNLGGGYEQFLSLANSLGIPDADKWVIGRPAAHPMTEVASYFQAADVIVQSSLEEGLGLSPLEALACGTPVIATAVGGMNHTLPGRGRLVSRRDPQAMAEQLLAMASDIDAARAEAIRVREEYIISEWNKSKAFDDLLKAIAPQKERLEANRVVTADQVVG